MSAATRDRRGTDPCVTLLHLSDPQFGRHHRFGTTESFETLLARLRDDLRGLREEHGLHPDLLVVTGDLAEGGRKAEFDQALHFLSELTEALDLARDRVAVVPGNHDVNRVSCENYFKECAHEEEEPQPPYWPKWKGFARFFNDFYRGRADVSFSAEEPWSLFEIDALKVVIAGLNSTMAESHRDEDHYGQVGERQLKWFRERLMPYREKGWLRIAAVHHNTIRAPVDDEHNLRDAEDLEEILGPYVNLILHGHTHAGKLHRLGNGAPVLSVGSAGVRKEDRPEEVPNQYQIVRIASDRFCRWTRIYVPQRKRFVGDNSISRSGDRWWDEQRAELEDVSATFPPEPKRPGWADFPPGRGRGRDLREPMDAAPRDDFLSRVERICRLREQDAFVERIDSSSLEYLRVSVRDRGIARSYPVAASRDGVSDATLDAFLAVHRRYQQADSGVISTLVYGGDPAPAELVRRAAAERVTLQSFVEYQGMIDFRGYVEQQTQKLAANPLYPPGLYVPQRLCFQEGEKERQGDALDTVTGWLADRYGRFVLILGDFGTGKTFFLHELARRMGEEQGPLTPILIEMHALEKGRNLDELVAQHLARSGMERIDLKAFRYMLEQGRIALLFDGFDELALRVTYDRAAEHFATLVEAARGNAKVVVTSRTQHFVSDRQIRTALGERVELLTGRRIARLQHFDETQIRRFLVNRLGDEAAAEARFQLLGEVRDLLGLSQNPRMLGFIADQSEQDLRAAKEKDGAITSASLYQLLLERWLVGEYERHQPRGALPALTVEERWDAVNQLALRLWQRTERAVDVRELTEEVARAVEALAERSLSEEEAAHQVGSGTLLVRDDVGAFSFIHQSVLEWLVARQAARELGEAKSPEVLAMREMSPLMADFLGDLAGRERVAEWAREVLAGGVGEIARLNALLLLDRLGKKTREPLRIAGQDLQGKDLSGQDLSGADLRGANLRSARLIATQLVYARLTGANLAGADLSQADLRLADLRHADLSAARLLGADLRQARLSGSVLWRSKLVGALLDEGALLESQIFGAALPKPDLVEPRTEARSVQCKAVTWSPDQSLIATGHADGSIRLWEIATGHEIRRLVGHESLVWSVAYSPDGQSLASGSRDKTVRIWDVTTGREQRMIEGHQDTVWSVAYSPDGQSLASGSDDNTIRLWDVATGREHRKIEGHESGVLYVAFSPDGQSLASGSRDTTVRIWDVATGHVQRKIEGQSVRLCVAYSPDGQSLVSGSDDNTIRLWDVATGCEQQRLVGHGSVVWSVAYSPDGRSLASGYRDNTVCLWDVATGREQRMIEGHEGPVWSVAYSPDGRSLASGSDDKTVRLWDVATGRVQRKLEGYESGVWSVAYTPNGRILASGSDGKTVHLWDVATGRVQRKLEGHEDWVLSVAYSPNGQSLVSGSQDATVRLWDVATGRVRQKLEGHKDTIWSVAYSPDGESVASGSRDTTVRIWDIKAGRVQRKLLEGHEASVWSVTYSPDGQILASSSYDATVRLWDVATGREQRKLVGHKDAVGRVAYSPDGRSLASGSRDAIVRLWDPATGREQRRFEGHKAAVWDLSYSPDGQSLASGSDDNTVRLWDAATGQNQRILEGHESGIRSVAYSPDGRSLASGSRDNTVRIWDVATGRCLAILVPLPEGWVAYTPDGRYKFGGEIAGGFWHSIGLCRFEPGELDPYLPSPLRVADDEPLCTLPR